jgi:hypothetical protein
MWVTIDADTFTPCYLHFMSPVKNAILEQSSFVRILYSHPSFTMNGLFLELNSKTDVSKIERDILEAHRTTKQKAHVITRFEPQPRLILKISGIWENDTACGLAYKFLRV